jgi:hypothetical protein
MIFKTILLIGSLVSCFLLLAICFSPAILVPSATNKSEASSTYFEVFRTKGLDSKDIDREINEQNDSAENIHDKIISYSMYPINSEGGKTIAFLVVIQIKKGKY